MHPKRTSGAIAVLALVAVVVATAWLARTSGTGRSASASSSAEASSGEPTSAATAELATPSFATSDPVARAPLAPVAPSAQREASGDTRPRGPLRGRLIDAEDRVPLAGERIVLLATPDREVAESLRSDADGRFTSTRAFPRGAVRAWVTEPSTSELLVRHEAEFDPAGAGEWLVPVPRQAKAPVAEETEASEDEGATLKGVVVDLGGAPVAAAQVKLIPLAPGGTVDFDDSESDGTFEVHGLVPGAYRLLVQGRFASSVPVELALVRGANDAGRVLLPAAASGGAIRGRIVASSETVAEYEDGHAAEEDPFGFLLLRANGRELGTATKWNVFSSEHDGASTFEFEAVPVGEYELELVPLDGREYEPRVVRVSPPAEGLEFRARGPARASTLVLGVRDAASGEELKHCVAFFRIHGQWFGGSTKSPCDDFPPCVERWVVYADGYRPVCGDFSGARVVRDDEGRECQRIDVALERGYGEVLLFKDLESDRLVVPDAKGLVGSGLVDVQVRADGVIVARSDADGLAVVDLARAPARLEFGRAGWRVAGESVEDKMRFVHMVRE